MRPGIEPRSPGPLANTLLTRPTSRSYIYGDIELFSFLWENWYLYQMLLKWLVAVSYASRLFSKAKLVRMQVLVRTTKIENKQRNKREFTCR